MRPDSEDTRRAARDVPEPLTLARSAGMLILAVLCGLAGFVLIFAISFYQQGRELRARGAPGFVPTRTLEELAAERVQIARSEMAAVLSATDHSLSLRINRAYEAVRRGNLYYVTHGRTASGAPTSVSRIDGVSPMVQIHAEVADGRPTLADALAGRAVLLLDLWRGRADLSMEDNTIDVDAPPLGTCIGVRALVVGVPGFADGERRDAPNAGRLCWQADAGTDTPRWVYVPPSP